MVAFLYSNVGNCVCVCVCTHARACMLNTNVRSSFSCFIYKPDCIKRFLIALLESINCSDRNKGQKLVCHFLKIGHLCKLSTAIPLKMYSKFGRGFWSAKC